LYKAVLTGAEDRLKQVLVENTELRRSIAHMQGELVTLLRNNESDSNLVQQVKICFSSCFGIELMFYLKKEDSPTDSGHDDTDSVDQSGDLWDGTYEMPFDLVSEDLYRSYTAKIQKLKQVIQQADRYNGQFEHYCDVEVL
jgi:hypothetical protein